MFPSDSFESIELNVVEYTPPQPPATVQNNRSLKNGIKFACVCFALMCIVICVCVVYNTLHDTNSTQSQMKTPGTAIHLQENATSTRSPLPKVESTTKPANSSHDWIYITEKAGIK